VQFPVALRPRRAEQDFRACGVDATPERDAAPQWLVCLRAPSRSHPASGSTFRRALLNVSAHLSPNWERGEVCGTVIAQLGIDRPEVIGRRTGTLLHQIVGLVG